jgi:hypothetical protein
MNSATSDSGNKCSDEAFQVIGMDVERLIEFLKTSNVV